MSSPEENKYLALSILVVFLLILILIFIYQNTILKQQYLHKQYVVATNQPATNMTVAPQDRPPYINVSSAYIVPTRTRGEPSSFGQIGILTSITPVVAPEPGAFPRAPATSKILPLYGRRLYTNSSKWNYYTRTDTFNSVSIPLKINNKDCSDEQGCDELYTGDTFLIPELGETFRVEIYKSTQFNYNPYQ